jgi:O-antigen/teichoic acid export membrane protein
LDVVRGLGPTDWLVVIDEEEVNEWAETIWTVNVVVGVVLLAAMAALGPVAASFFGEPELVTIMPVLGANFMVGSLSYVHDALAQKRMMGGVRLRVAPRRCRIRGNPRSGGGAPR